MPDGHAIHETREDAAEDGASQFIRGCAQVKARLCRLAGFVHPCEGIVEDYEQRLNKLISFRARQCPSLMTCPETTKPV